MKTLLLYLVTAIAEIVGCYLPLLWLRGQGSGWVLLPSAALSLATFAWLLSLHAAPSGRVYAAYGGVYMAVALGWLWSIDGVRPSSWDVAGVAVTLTPVNGTPIAVTTDATGTYNYPDMGFGAIPAEEVHRVTLGVLAVSTAHVMTTDELIQKSRQ